MPLNTVFRHPTVEGLCAELPHASRALRRLVVPLAEGDRRRAPLILVHPQSGDVCSFLHLAGQLTGRLAESPAGGRPVHGLEAVGYNTDEPPLATVEEQAQRYLRELRSVLPDGPYLLAGWSFGGLVAFEMARLLEEQGNPRDSSGSSTSERPRPPLEPPTGRSGTSTNSTSRTPSRCCSTTPTPVSAFPGGGAPSNCAAWCGSSPPTATPPDATGRRHGCGHRSTCSRAPRPTPR